jgi:AraC-like DNA-binding protein
MFIFFDRDRASDSPFIERVWSCHSERAGLFSSVASPHLELVFTRLNGGITATLRGPETRARQVPCPANGEWLAIRFKAGTFMRSLRAPQLLDGNDVSLPQVSPRSFWLEGAKWELPSFENAEAFVARLAKADVIARDAGITAALESDSREISDRSIQRRFLSVCGMSYSTMRQIERARHAAGLLTRGVSISETQFAAGFYDQPHLTRSLKRYAGLTPASILRGEHQLSFLYKK